MGVPSGRLPPKYSSVRRYDSPGVGAGVAAPAESDAAVVVAPAVVRPRNRAASIPATAVRRVVMRPSNRR
jgi:hypothetical protein